MDKPIIEYVFTYKGYKCCVLFQDLGFRCGYVLVPRWHPLYEVEYKDCTINCHGGITYSDHKLLGEQSPSWWIGFDCAHAGDKIDYECLTKYYGKVEEDSYFNTMRWLTGVDSEEFSSVKNLNFCKQECMHIVDQLVEME